jgi:hypothetical protein
MVVPLLYFRIEEDMWEIAVMSEGVELVIMGSLHELYIIFLTFAELLESLLALYREGEFGLAFACFLELLGEQLLEEEGLGSIVESLACKMGTLDLD